MLRTTLRVEMANQQSCWRGGDNKQLRWKLLPPPQLTHRPFTRFSGPLRGLCLYHPPSTPTESFCMKFGLGEAGRRQHRLPCKSTPWCVVPPGRRVRVLVAVQNGLAIYGFNPVPHLWNIPFLLLWSKCKYYLAKGSYPQGKRFLRAVALELELTIT